MSQPSHERPRSLYTSFNRKAGDHDVTHYCPGCGHGNLHKYIAEAIDDFGIADRTVFVDPVGCSVFAYYYLDVAHVQVAHGRAPAVATAVKRARPQSIVIAYQGDGDLAAIGGNEILQAANRGEPITVIFVNNALYGMTGGQMAPTTLLGQRTATTPLGRSASSEGYPMKVCELLATLDAPVYLERVALGNAKRDMAARKAVRKAIQNQIEGKGFSLVEILSPCPTGWKLTPGDATSFVLETMTQTFPLGVVRDRAAGERPGPTGARLPIEIGDIPRILGLRGNSLDSKVSEDSSEGISHGQDRAGAIDTKFRSCRIKAAGFGGQGVLFLGALIAEAGMLSGRAVSWLPSYGPEMRGGTAHCHVIVSEAEVDSPLVTRASVLFAMNRPSLQRFLPDVEDGGLVIYDSTLIEEPRDLSWGGVESIGVPATRIAESLGSARVANAVALGIFLDRTRALDASSIENALRSHSLKPETIALNMAALNAGWKWSEERPEA